MRKLLDKLKVSNWSATEKRTGMDVGFTAAFVAVVVILNVILYSLCSLFSWYFWVDDDAKYEVTDVTAPYLAAVNPEEKPVTFHFCMPMDKIKTNREFLRVYETVLQFSEKYGYIEIESVNIYTDYEKVAAWSAAHDGATVNEQSVVVTCEDRSFIAAMETFYVYQERDNAARMEYNGEETVCTLLHLAVAGHESLPKALFTTGHNEEATTSLYNVLTSSGYSIGTVDLVAEDIPSDCELLIIAAPLSDFTDYSGAVAGVQFVSEVGKLEEFRARGGHVLVLRSALSGTKLTNLDKFLADNGLAVDALSTVKDTQNGVGTDGFFLLSDVPAAQTALAERIRAFNATRILTGKANPILLGEGGLRTTLTPILESADTSSIVAADGTETAGRATLAAVSTAENGDGTVSHLVLATSPDLLAYDMMETNGYANEEWIYAIMEQYFGRTVPIGCHLMILNAHPVENLTLGETNLYLILLGGVLPLAVAVVGAVICGRRRFR